MKKSNFASPFCLLLFFIFSAFWPNAYSQEQTTDSTAYYYRSINYRSDSQQIKKSISFLQNQLKTNDKRDDPIYRYRTLEYISLGQYYIGDIFKSETSAIETYKALERTATTPQTNAARVRLANHLGGINSKVGNFQNALTYYTKAIPLVIRKSDSLIVLNNIASIHIKIGAYQKAVDILAPFVNSTDAIPEDQNLSTVLDNYGNSLSLSNNPDGLSFLQRALEINKKIQYSRGLFSTYRHMAEHYKAYGNMTEAKTFARKAKKIADDLNTPYFKQEALGLAIETGDTQDALAYKRLSDSLKNVRQLEENKYVAKKYEYAQFQTKAKENELVAQKEISKNRTYQFLVLILILVAIAIISISRIINRKKRVEEILKTEARFSKKVHDEVSNDVYRVMTHIQNKKGLYPKILDNLEDIYKRTRDISRENALIDVDTDFNIILKDLFLGYQSNTLNVITRNREGIQWDDISKSKKITLYRVLQELITNTSKHGKAAVILITFAQKRRKISVLYSDNGIGGDLSDKNGLQNVETRISAHKGTITFDSKPRKGFKAQIHL